MKLKSFLLFSIISLLFFSASMLTMRNYGISWDEPTHFKRGQAYLRFFLTGERNYEKLPKYNLEKARSDPNYHERSIYQNDTFNIDYYMQKDGGHPPLNGILASLFNLIFYQKLGVMEDAESYHVFGILISAILIGTVFLFGAEVFGLWVGLFAAIFISTYPLFWAEAHFNIKDPIEITFFTLTIYTLWKGLTQKKVFFILLSSVFAGLALSTKFNILFLPFIIIPWLLIRQFILNLGVRNLILKRRIAVALFIFPVIMFGIFFITWPYLWQDLLDTTFQVFKYYKEIGTETEFQPNFLVGSWNTYAASWILYTTQPVMLIFFILGVIGSFFYKADKKDILILWLIWFVVPILRVSIPMTTIYGGVRQIMEYIVPMSLLAGFGVHFLMTRFQKPKIPYFTITVFSAVSIISIYTLVRLHPNENVYFNFLTGGLKGAVDKGIPAAGHSFGNAYMQGVKWFNENAPQNAKLALIQGTTLNIPAYKFRPDIQYSNFHWSGIKREGEYLIELTYNSEVKVYHYAWEYVEKMLEPVYEVKVDGVPILKIWKNDLEHTKLEYRKNEVSYSGKKDIQIEGQSLKIITGEEVNLSRLIVNFSPSFTCEKVISGFVETSLDGKNWFRERDRLLLDQLGYKGDIKPNSSVFMFAHRLAKFINVNFDDINSCALNRPVVNLVIFQ